MPSDSPTSASASGPTANDAAARLKEIRGRVAELRRRIQSERDPKAVAEVRDEVGKLTALLNELVQAGGTGKGAVSKAEPVVWPKDLSAAPGGTGDWGADPAEVAVG